MRYVFPLIFSLHSYWLNKFVMLLYVLQDLIGLEGDDLLDFMPSAGNKYGILSTIFSGLFIAFVRSVTYHYVLKWGN